MPTAYDAIVFDVLDTIYPWGPDRYGRALDALCETVSARCPPHTPKQARERYIDIRTVQSSINLSQLRENDFPAYVRELVEKLGGAGPGEVASEAVRNYNTAFADALELPEGVLELFRDLSSRFRLGVLSNYPTSGGIRAALERDGLAPLLGATVVSSEIGYIKPHPEMFRTVYEQLGCRPERTLLVGDTWESDVVGAWLSGLPCVRVTPSAAGVEQGRFFNGHIRKWLESQADGEWRKAKPLIEIDHVRQLPEWLSGTFVTSNF